MTEIKQVLTSNTDGIETITGVGTLDLYVVDKFKQALSEAIASENEVVVDFRQVLFIDTSIIAALVAPSKAMIKRSSRLKVKVADGAYPQYVLRIVGFNDLLDIIVDNGDASANG